MKFLKGSAALLAFGLLFAAAPNVLNAATGVEAAAPTDGITYQLVGTINLPGTETMIDWGLDSAPYATWVDDESKTEFSWADGYHEFVFEADAGDTFKIVVNGPGWGQPWWMKFGEMFMNTSYFEDGGGNDHNVLVKEAGTYTLRFTHEYHSSDGANKPNNIHITGTVAEVLHTVTVMNGENVVETVEVADGSTYQPHQSFVEDHILEGYYTDPEFTTPYDGAAPIHEDTIIYAHYVECPTEDYWVYYQTYTDSPLDHVYYWNSDTGFAVPWSGEGVQIAEPVTLSTATIEGKTIYGILIKAEYQADFIIFHNDQGGYSNQTVDLALPSKSCVYNVERPTTDGTKISGVMYSDSDTYADALNFLNYWSTIRIDNDVYDGKTYDNSICYLLTDTEAWNELNGRYTALSADSKGLVDPVKDVEGWTVGQTMEYLTNAHSEPAVGPAASVFFSEPENVAGITAGALVLVSILGFSVFYFVRRRKHASN